MSYTSYHPISTVWITLVDTEVFKLRPKLYLFIYCWLLCVIFIERIFWKNGKFLGSRICALLKLALFGITFLLRAMRIVKSNEQLENWSWLVKFRKPFVNWFSLSDGWGNFWAFLTCSRCENQILYHTKMIPNSANALDNSMHTTFACGHPCIAPLKYYTTPTCPESKW